uniref:Uncharacterized protein n=1 Tax=Micrurus lemniscatus lemniscatus TaxID=129467 RepID=A0A2D4IMY3_MICLE
MKKFPQTFTKTSKRFEGMNLSQRYDPPHDAMCPKWRPLKTRQKETIGTGVLTAVPFWRQHSLELPRTAPRTEVANQLLCDVMGTEGLHCPHSYAPREDR